MEQHTVKRAFTLSGMGLHSGRPVNMIVKPAQEGVGIVLVRSDLHRRPLVKASIENLTSSVRGTNIGEFHTVEHLMAAFYVCGITNAFVELDSPEPPALDGSALMFIEAIEHAGTVRQGEKAAVLKISSPIVIRSGDKFIMALPSDRFRVSFMINYRFPFIGAQYFSSDIDKKKFKSSIAPARTYGFLEELEALKAKGLGLGASTLNAVAISDVGYVNSLRFKNELVRHKVLDLVGDMSLVGCEIKAHIIGVRSGHELNAALCKELSRR
jgi:UDP-3-O-[3-hydroxymyristoyl] N-acetylglucosamine deacetylase